MFLSQEGRGVFSSARTFLKFCKKGPAKFETGQNARFKHFQDSHFVHLGERAICNIVVCYDQSQKQNDGIVSKDYKIALRF